MSFVSIYVVLRPNGFSSCYNRKSEILVSPGNSPLPLYSPLILLSTYVHMHAYMDICVLCTHSRSSLIRTASGPCDMFLRKYIFDFNEMFTYFLNRVAFGRKRSIWCSCCFSLLFSLWYRQHKRYNCQHTDTSDWARSKPSALSSLSNCMRISGDACIMRVGHFSYCATILYMIQTECCNAGETRALLGSEHIFAFAPTHKSISHRWRPFTSSQHSILVRANLPSSSFYVIRCLHRISIQLWDANQLNIDVRGMHHTNMILSIQDCISVQWIGRL